MCRPPKPRKERKEISEVDTVDLDAQQIADGAEAEEALETALELFRDGDQELAATAAAMKELLGKELGVAAELDFDFSAEQFLELLSPNAPLRVAAPLSDDLPEYDGPEVDLPDMSWVENVLA